MTVLSSSASASATSAGAVPDWHIRGHVEEGSFGDVPLAGLNFGVAVNWPGAIHEGNGEAIVVLDERADAAGGARGGHARARGARSRGRASMSRLELSIGVIATTGVMVRMSAPIRVQD